MDTTSYASCAASLAPGNAPLRARFAVYLAQFCSYFKDTELLPLLVTAVTTDTPASEAQGLAVIEADLARVFEDLKARDPSIPRDCSNVLHWIWDVSVLPPLFDVEAARKLFAAIGVVKTNDWQPDHAGTCALHVRPPRGPILYETLRSGAELAHTLVFPPASIKISAAGDARGGGTGREYVSNLLGTGCEPWNKWLHPGWVTASWVCLDFPRPARLTGYGVCSANDCPNRDPIEWTVMGRTAGGPWVALHSVRGTPAFAARWQWLRFAFEGIAAETEWSAVRLDIHRVRVPGDGLQLGHFHVYGGAVQSENKEEDPVPVDNDEAIPDARVEVSFRGKQLRGALDELDSKPAASPTLAAILKTYDKDGVALSALGARPDGRAWAVTFFELVTTQAEGTSLPSLLAAASAIIHAALVTPSVLGPFVNALLSSLSLIKNDALPPLSALHLVSAWRVLHGLALEARLLGLWRSLAVLASDANLNQRRRNEFLGPYINEDANVELASLRRSTVATISKYL